jgi:hypothetical protein
MAINIMNLFIKYHIEKIQDMNKNISVLLQNICFALIENIEVKSGCDMCWNLLAHHMLPPGVREKLKYNGI